MSLNFGLEKASSSAARGDRISIKPQLSRLQFGFFSGTLHNWVAGVCIAILFLCVIIPSTICRESKVFEIQTFFFFTFNSKWEHWLSIASFPHFAWIDGGCEAERSAYFREIPPSLRYTSFIRGSISQNYTNKSAWVARTFILTRQCRFSMSHGFVLVFLLFLQ